MSKENTSINPIILIDTELEEKRANLQGLATKIQQAHKFIQENEPNAIALNGAIQQLELINPLPEEKPKEKVN